MEADPEMTEVAIEAAAAAAVVAASTTTTTTFIQNTAATNTTSHSESTRSRRKPLPHDLEEASRISARREANRRHAYKSRQRHKGRQACWFVFIFCKKLHVVELFENGLICFNVFVSLIVFLLLLLLFVGMLFVQQFVFYVL
jgi:hypothetical protein